MVIHQPTTFGGHGHCGSGTIMVLACHLILQNHVIEAWHNFMSRSPSR